jgi:hypothetical protein
VRFFSDPLDETYPAPIRLQIHVGNIHEFFIEEPSS